MKAHSKIILDRLIGRPAAFLLNLIVWPVGKILRISHDDSPEKVKTIAVAKFLGLGSIIRATPFIRALKAKYPGARYIFITTAKNRELVETLGLFDGFYYIRDSSFLMVLADTARLLISLWKERIDLYFDLEVYSAFSTLLTTASLARNRYGFYIASVNFRRQLHTHLVYFNHYQHISRVYLALARACGIKSLDETLETVRPSEQGKRDLLKWLAENGLSPDTPYLVINCNASDLMYERRWPLKYFTALINALSVTWPGHFFLIGSKEEQSYVESLRQGVSENARSRVYNTAGLLSLDSVMHLIKGARLLITNDSGLYHIGSSLKTATLSMWGPQGPAHYADPPSDSSVIFYSEKVYCSPCVHRTGFPPCKGNNICMKSIPPMEVYLAACKILGIAPAASTREMDEIFSNEYDADIDITVRNRALKLKGS